MNFFEGFPWSNKQALNLDWLLNTMKNLLQQFTEFKAVNTLTYGGIWDITKNYPAWTIVTTGNSGYISLQPVPVGVPLTNREYWIEAVELDPRIAGIIEQIAEMETEISNNKTAIDDIKKLQYDVKNFGAVGDGETDDTAAIQKAVNTGYAFFSPGVYKISSPINIPGDTKITGSGCKSVIHNTTGYAFEAVDAYNIIIDSLSFYGGSESGGILFTSVSESTISNCKFTRYGTQCIKIAGEISIMPRIIDNIFRGDESKIEGVAIQLDYGSSDHVISGNDIGWFATGILLSQSEGGIVDKCTVWQCGVAFDIYDSDRSRLTNCLADLAKQYSFKFTNIDNAVITGNICKDGSVDGAGLYPAFGFYGTTTQTVISDNSISGSNYSYAFLLEKNFSGVTIRNSTLSFFLNILSVTGAPFQDNVCNLFIDNGSMGRPGTIVPVDVGTYPTIPLEFYCSDYLDIFGSNTSVTVPKYYHRFTLRNSTADLQLSDGTNNHTFNVGVFDVFHGPYGFKAVELT